jgi:hypothetical protein
MCVLLYFFVLFVFFFFRVVVVVFCSFFPSEAQTVGKFVGVGTPQGTQHERRKKKHLRWRSPNNLYLDHLTPPTTNIGTRTH